MLWRIFWDVREGGLRFLDRQHIQRLQDGEDVPRFTRVPLYWDTNFVFDAEDTGGDGS